MKIGICTSSKNGFIIKSLKKVGCEYLETSFSAIASMTDKAYNRYLSIVQKNEMPVIAANLIFPSKFKITNGDGEKALRFFENALPRAEKLGVKMVIFGSGGAREIAEGVNPKTAYATLVDFTTKVAAVAKKHGIFLVIEPLSDCNIINTAQDGAKLSADSGDENVGTLVDLYHTEKTKEKPSDWSGIHIYHSHIAFPSKRTFPSEKDGFDYSSFMKAIQLGGCETCSIEAKPQGFLVHAAKKSIALLKKY